MIYYSESTLKDLFHNETFLKDCEDYKSSNTELIKTMDFINNIELNKKYFRLEMNKKRGYKKRNQFKETDTTCIKEVTSLLNKLTDKNILSIRTKIKTKLEDKNYLKNLTIDSILEKCIIHTTYIPLYLDLINYLYGNGNNEIIKMLTDKLYQSILNIEYKEESDYLRMCERNKKLDKLIGHSLLITELEKKKIVTGEIHPTLENFIVILSECDEDEEKYKCVQCLYNILKSYYGEYILPEGYNQKIKSLIEKEKTMKIKFKMMDILERR